MGVLKISIFRGIWLRFLVFIFLISSIIQVTFAQQQQDDTINIFESLNDSMNLSSAFFDVSDSLGIFFFNNDSSDVSVMPYRYDSLTKAYGGDWSNDVLFLFNKDNDPSKMEDSIKIPLQDNEGHCFYMPRHGILTSNFGWRRWQFHYGVDIGLNRGDTVRCAFDGVVRISKWGWGYGNVIVVRHLNGLETLYGHLSASKVLPNQPVKAGEVLGLGGSTGRSTGPHLHFEIRYQGAPLNPNSLIDISNGVVWKDTVYISKKSFRYVSDIKKVSGSAKYYTIKSGDSLSKIALKSGSNVKTICNLNGIKPTTILKVGRTIRVR
jgi:LysM repeat protein